MTPMEGRRGAKGEFYRQQTPIQTQHPQHSPISWQQPPGAAAPPRSSELGCGNTGNERRGLTLRPATAHGPAGPVTPASHIHGKPEGSQDTALPSAADWSPVPHRSPKGDGAAQPSLPPHPAQRMQAGWRETPKCLAPAQAHAKMKQLSSSLERRMAMLSKEEEGGQGALKAGSGSREHRQAAV